MYKTPPIRCLYWWLLLSAAAFGQTLDVTVATEQNGQIHTVAVITELEAKYVSVEVLGWDSRGLVNVYRLHTTGLNYLWVPPAKGEYDVTVRAFSPETGFLPTRTEKVTVGEPVDPDKPPTPPDDKAPEPDEYQAGQTSYDNSREMTVEEKKILADIYTGFAAGLLDGTYLRSQSPPHPDTKPATYEVWRTAVQANLDEAWPLGKSEYAAWCNYVAGGLK